MSEFLKCGIRNYISSKYLVAFHKRSVGYSKQKVKFNISVSIVFQNCALATTKTKLNMTYLYDKKS